MNNIQIIADSTAYLEKSFCTENNIVVVPLSYVFEGKTETEGFPGEFNSFFTRLKTSSDFPVTSQPSVGAFKKVYEEALAKGKDIVVITLSSKISGTYNSASLAAEMLEASKISVIDSGQLGANIFELVKTAISMSAEGKTRTEIEARINEQKKRMNVRVIPATLDYLRKGGRISNFASIVGNIMNLKPIIGFTDGKLEVVTKARGFKKAIKLAIDDIPADAKSIYISHVIAFDDAVELKNEISELFPDAKVDIAEIGPIIGCHNGPGMLAIVFAS